MNLLTEDALLVCNHVLGTVGLRATQGLVTIEARRVLVEGDPEGRPITGCPHVSAVTRPCLTTLKVQQGYSSLVSIEGQRVCLASVAGLTDGTPPGTVRYKVRDPGQQLVSEGA
jgi:hypothetical protein